MITVIQIHAGGLLIGDVDTIVGVITLKSPRVIQMQQAGPGQVRVDFAVLIGDPKEIRMGEDKIALYYEPDESLKNLYREAVTGLTLAKTLPVGANVKQFPKGN